MTNDESDEGGVLLKFDCNQLICDDRMGVYEENSWRVSDDFFFLETISHIYTLLCIFCIDYCHDEKLILLIFHTSLLNTQFVYFTRGVV